jgi:uncharacterized membrane protein
VAIMGNIVDALVYAFNYIGHLVCHQLPERSFWVGGHYLPVCARDTGVYLGFFIGYMLLPLRKKDACGPPNLWMTLLMTMPMVIDGTTQLVGFRTSTNELRLLTGLLFGAALAPLLIYSLALLPTSKTVPWLRKVIPKCVELDDKDSWLSRSALSRGLLIAIILFFVINAMAGSSDQIFYWILSSPIILAIVLHIFVLPIFVVVSLLVSLKKGLFNSQLRENN